MDVIETSDGALAVTFIGHASLIFSFLGKVIHVDPWTKLADYSAMPKADLILITHEHRDHLDVDAVRVLRQEGTMVVANQASAGQIPGSLAMKNGEVRSVQGVKVEAVPAYNAVHLRPDGQPYHPRGNGNGYVLTFGDKRVYVAGDTENIPEMKDLRDIAVAFLPMNLPYTMTPEMMADAARAIRPRILYPYHYGESDASLPAKLLGDAGIEIRIRNLK